MLQRNTHRLPHPVPAATQFENTLIIWGAGGPSLWLFSILNEPGVPGLDMQVEHHIPWGTASSGFPPASGLSYPPEGSSAQLHGVGMSLAWKDQGRRGANFGQVSTLPASEIVFAEQSSIKR